MSDTNSLDYVGYAAVEFVPASGTFYYIPLRPESQFVKPNALTPEFLAASQAFEPINWVQGLSQPVLLARTRIFSTWFFADSLHRMLGCAGATGAPAYRNVYGQIAPMGRIQISDGFNKVQYSNWKVNVLALSGGGAGTPIDVTMILMCYGTDQSETLTDVSATPEPTSGPSSTPMPYHSHGLSTGDYSAVNGFSMAFGNGLAPDVSYPITPIPSGIIPLLPPEYSNGPLLYTYSVTQKDGAGTVVDAAGGGIVTSALTSTMVLNAPDNASGTNALTFQLSALVPDLTKSFSLTRFGLRTRAYKNIKESSTVTSLRIS